MEKNNLDNEPIEPEVELNPESEPEQEPGVEGGVPGEEDGEKKVEPWLETDEQTSDDGVMPVAAHVKAKKKLKGIISEKDDELASLRDELKALKERRIEPTKTVQAIEKPPSEYDFDSAKEYQAALAAYHNKLSYESVRSELQKQKQAEEESRKRKEITDAVDLHYERAEKLISETGIEPEKYKSADHKFRSAVDSVFKGKGDAVVDGFISMLGDGSEKVAYYVGNNESARAKLQAMLMSDPSGLKAAIFLGEQKARLTGATLKKQTSKAPAPAPNADKGAGGASGKDFKKAFDAAEKKGDTQAAYDARSAAKKAGVDVSKW